MGVGKVPMNISSMLLQFSRLKLKENKGEKWFYAVALFPENPLVP